TLMEGIMTQGTDRASGSQETVLSTANPAMAASGRHEPDEAIVRPREARQSPCAISTVPTQTASPARMQPPAFLDPANRDKVRSAELRRLAERPMKAGRTIDLLSPGKRRPPSTPASAGDRRG